MSRLGVCPGGGARHAVLLVVGSIVGRRNGHGGPPATAATAIAIGPAPGWWRGAGRHPLVWQRGRRLAGRVAPHAVRGRHPLQVPPPAPKDEEEARRRGAPVRRFRLGTPAAAAAADAATTAAAAVTATVDTPAAAAATALNSCH